MARGMIRIGLGGVAFLCVWLAIAPARAEEPPPSGVVLASGTVQARDLATISSAIQTAVQQAGWSLPLTPLPHAESERMLKCIHNESSLKCFPASPPLTRIFVVTAKSVTGPTGLPIIALTGQALASGEGNTAIRQQHCENCSIDKLTEASTKLAEIVLRDLALRLRRTFVEFRSMPPEAEIFLDGVRIGITDGTFNTYPGEHVARFEKAGYRTETRKFVVDNERTAKVAAEMQPESGPVRPPGATPSKVAPIALIAGGAALVVTGVVWSAYGTKDGADDRYRYPRALWIGIPTAIVGTAAAVVGVTWLVKQSRSAPTASVTPGGAVIGWMGTF